MTTMWESYNGNTSWMTFLVPLTLWLGGFLACNWDETRKGRHAAIDEVERKEKRIGRKSFHEWQALHNLHNLGGIVIGLASIWIHDDAVFNERISILWSLSYFCVDLVDCIQRGDIPFTLHAFFCIVLGVGCYTSRPFRVERINSKALLCELSSPFLHLAKRTRKPHHFALFALVFFLCRILWLPYFLKELRHYGTELRWYNGRIFFILAFYSLNLYWFFKIVHILFRGMSRGDDLTTHRPKHSKLASRI